MKRILLMDDSSLFLAVTSEGLRRAGFEVVCASDLESFAQVRGAPVDLVLMDVQMPEAFGDDIAMTLRYAHDLHVPIYLLSSLPDPELATRAAEAGIDGYISKLVGVAEIVRRVHAILAGAGA
jgi:DNA-binding response OmpR family regulator